jgi:exodeoxyribonuclease VII small subunit
MPRKKKDWNYEETVNQVELIVEKIETGNLDLAEVFEQFAIAAKQLQQCEQFLNEKQQQIDLLVEVLEPTDQNLTP